MPRRIFFRLRRRSVAGRISVTFAGGLVLLALVLGVLDVALPKKKPATRPCGEGRYVLPPGSPPLLAGAAPGDLHAVTLQQSGSRRTVSVGGGCDPVRARVKGTRRGTTIGARWRRCGDAKAVVLSARVTADCQRLTGTLRGKGLPRRRFEATLSRCGDGTLDPALGEACEEASPCDGGIPCIECRCDATTSTTAPGSSTTTSTVSAPSTTLPGAATTSTAVPASTSTTSSTVVGPTTTTTTTLPGTLPPDPVEVAPPAPGVAVSFATGVSFLWNGSGIQTGVAPGTIADERAAVLRGRVLDVAGQPLGGVQVTVLSQPEYGQTLTRADGRYDLGVNGGGGCTLQYRKAGYLEVQRQGAPLHNAFERLPDVVMTPLDPAVTVVTLDGRPAMQIARGTPIEELGRTRRATVLFPGGTQATLTLPGGSTQPITTLGVRATEFTVGPRGQEAMPGVLPPRSAYTYALELSVDEAVAAGATRVGFDRPVVVYVDDFLGLPPGTAMPLGLYDRADAAWKAEPDGVVVEVLGAAGDLALLNLDGDPEAEDAAALAAAGIDEAERRAVAGLYPAGHKLWRTTVSHFSSYDQNLGLSLPPDWCPEEYTKCPPDPLEIAGRAKFRKFGKKHPCLENGSILSCTDQSVVEEIPVTGTPYTLRYSSARAKQRAVDRSYPIELLGDGPLPQDVLRVEIDGSVAGQPFSARLAPSAGLTYTVEWDGRDGYGRPVYGTAELSGAIAWIFPPTYRTYGRNQLSARGTFGRSETGAFAAFLSDRVAGDLTARRAFSVKLHGYAPVGADIGGWTLDVVHDVDPRSGEVFFGDGSFSSLGNGRVVTIAGSTQSGSTPPDGAPATSSTVRAVDLVGAPDGGVWMLVGPDVIGNPAKLTTDGRLVRLGCQAAPGVSCPPLTDTSEGSPASDFRMVAFPGIVVDHDGRLVFSEGNRIWRIEADGRLTRLAGDPTARDPFPVDGGNARDTNIRAHELAAAPDGSIYFIHEGPGSEDRVYRIAPDGRLEHIAGTGDRNVLEFTGDGGPAREASFRQLERGLAVDPKSGAVYVVDEPFDPQGPEDAPIIVRIAPDGMIEHIAGSGAACLLPGSSLGKPAREACLRGLKTVRVGPDGGLYGMIRTQGTGRMIVRFADTLSLVAGNGDDSPEGGDPTDTYIGHWDGSVFDFTARGTIAYSDRAREGGTRVREVALGLARQPDGGLLVPDARGVSVHVFDADGRHRETRDRLTGAVRLALGYDAGGRLVTLTDEGGNVTTIARAASGAPEAIVSPGGQRTTLEVNAQGLLASVASPADERITMTYAGAGDGLPDDSGLLKTFRLPSGATTQMTWSDEGLLRSHRNPTGGVTALTEAETEDGVEVTRTTPGGATWTYRLSQAADGGSTQVTVAPGGATSTAARAADGTVTLTEPNGTVVTAVPAPDPTFGLLLPYLESARIEKGATTVDLTGTRTRTTGTGYLDTGTVTDTLTIQGATWTVVRDHQAREIRRTSPGGRTHMVSFDALGRPTTVSRGGQVAPLTFGWNAKSLLATFAKGAEQWTYSYDAKNRVTGIGHGDRTLGFTFDAGDRPLTATLAPGETYAMAWDADGHFTSITDPDGNQHGVEHDALGRRTRYTPPGAAEGYRAVYRNDRSLEKLVLPSGREIAFTRDAAERPTGLAYPEAGVAIAYDGLTDLPSSLVRTPAAGTAHTMAFTWHQDLLEQAASSGAATGTYSYTRDERLRVSSVGFQSLFDAVTEARAYDVDDRVVRRGFLTLERGGPDGLASTLTSGPATIAIAYTPELTLASRTLTVNGAARHAMTLGWNALGLPVTRAETIGGTETLWEYTYDAHARLVQVERDGGVVEAYAYDARGNRTSAAAGGAPVAAAYDEQDRQTSRGATTYAFDDDGFLASRGGDTFTWSAAGELLGATVGGTTVAYDYDALRRRVRRTQGGAITEFFYGDPDDPLLLTASRAPDGVLTTYTYDDTGWLTLIRRGPTSWYVATDQVGSPRLVTNAAGTTVRRVEYDAFGRASTPVDTDASLHLPIGFAGGLADPTTGLVRFGFRDYEPETGRWTARDAAFLGGKQMNLYAYVGSSPVGLRDPSGTFSIGFGGYAILGGGLKLNITSEGFSACAEVGAGAGGGVDVQPFAGLDETFNGFEAGAAVKLGPLASLGIEGNYGQYGDPYDKKSPSCFKGDGSFKGGLGPLEADIGKAFKGDLSDTKGSPGGVKDLGALFRGETEFSLAPKVEGKVVWKSCGQALW